MTEPKIKAYSVMTESAILFYLAEEMTTIDLPEEITQYIPEVLSKCQVFFHPHMIDSAITLKKTLNDDLGVDVLFYPRAVDVGVWGVEFLLDDCGLLEVFRCSEE